MSKPLYVFDMDETLISTDCASLWHEFLVAKGIAIRPDFIEEDKRLMTLYAQGRMDMGDYLKFAISPIANIPVEEVKSLVSECVEQYILPKQYPQSITLIEQLARDGIDMVIISASVTFLVEAVGKRIGIPNALGIDLVENQGCFTTEISGIPSYREGKVTRLQQWLASQTTEYSVIHFYTDSINDQPLCEFADFAYLVNPCPRLRAIADQPNWTILSWG
ncbi:HAD-IB family hydrolase [Vibrio sp. S4M6]|uniref:HAD family hydrolase n=1 Tax=Vibrio sinus TaxID=2946865 RepID=UPI00202A282D|nr:HAD family hydrolase [Vibrio sinus]MCL9780258.1 HAD-IB family hydrolase [Vibrio sinus]